MLSFKQVQEMARDTASNPEKMKKHLWKTQPCRYGVKCRNMETCCAAHFKDEYHAPLCLHLEFCNRLPKGGCDRFHPHLGSAEGYMEMKGIRFEFKNREEWASSKMLTGRRAEVQKMAHSVASNPEKLRAHLWKSKPCRHGEKCPEMETCGAAHFLDEYRVPVCLHLEFCQKKGCEHYHPHMGSAEGYMAIKGIVFEHKTFVESKDARDKNEEKKVEMGKHVKERVLPLGKGGKSEYKKPDNQNNKNKRLCRHVKDGAMCQRAGCGFAHSLEDLVFLTCRCSRPDCEKYHIGHDRAEYVKRVLKIDIEPWMLRPSHENNVYLEMDKKTEEEIDVVCDELDKDEHEFSEQQIAFLMENGLRLEDEDEVCVLEDDEDVYEDK